VLHVRRIVRRCTTVRDALAIVRRDFVWSSLHSNTHSITNFADVLFRVA
jgi:hypothetical protein